jgi:DNA modification methylase
MSGEKRSPAARPFGVGETPLSGLRPWDRNPRRIAAGRLDDLRRALEADPEMLWARPLVALPGGTVVCGNQRLKAAQEAGWTTIPVVVVDLDPERARLWALRDNQAWGEWDEPALAELLAELAADGVDLTLAGFEGREVERLLAGIVPPGDPDELPPFPTGPPETEPGELCELGPHRLLCASATDPTAIERALAGEVATLLLTDPPWGVAYEGKTAARLRIANDDAAGQRGFLRAAFAAIKPGLAPGSPFYIFSPAGAAGTEFRLAIAEAGWRLAQGLVWVKDTIVLGHSDYHYKHEDILFGHTPGPGRPGRGRHRGSRWYGGNDQASVLFCDRPKRSAEHPTAKPVELLCRLIANSSKRGDLVLDPFGGSGATLIACELLGRRCVTLELDPRYADVIRRRYQEYTDG